MAYASSVIGPSKRIVITGGPGAGKTAVLELARRDLCKHVEILPEAARIVFGGGFPRRVDDAGRRGAQRAIFHVQDELERMGARRPSARLCSAIGARLMASPTGLGRGTSTSACWRPRCKPSSRAMPS